MLASKETILSEKSLVQVQIRRQMHMAYVVARQRGYVFFGQLFGIGDAGLRFFIRGRSSCAASITRLGVPSTPVANIRSLFSGVPRGQRGSAWQSRLGAHHSGLVGLVPRTQTARVRGVPLFVPETVSERREPAHPRHYRATRLPGVPGMRSARDATPCSS